MCHSAWRMACRHSKTASACSDVQCWGKIGRRRNAGSRWIGWAMIVTSRLVVEDSNILPNGAVFAGPNQCFDEASKHP